MRRVLVLCAVVLLVAGVVPAGASTIALYVDSAPNATYGAWKTASYPSVVAGTFTNMAGGTFPGTLKADPLDLIVYSTGDLGKRLAWIYWLPGQTVAGLTGHFQIRDVVDWDGEAWTYDWNTGNQVLATPDAGWTEPASWINYAGGVIGAFSDAWWATDDEALPFTTDASPYNEVNAADIAALRQQVMLHDTYWRGEVRLLDDAGNVVQTQSLQVDVVPEPATMSLFGFGLASVVAAVRRKSRRG